MSDITISKPYQFYHENKTWERILDFFLQENTFLKNRLSEVVDQNNDKEFLALAEQFQNRFILKDEFINEIRHDIINQKTGLKQYEQVGKPIFESKHIKMQHKLRNEMEYLEKDFIQLKNEFNKYLSSLNN